MRWRGFRRVRRQVCRRIGDRLKQLGLGDLERYRLFLERNPGEWVNLRPLLRVTISRFYRDRAVFNAIRWCAFPRLAVEAKRERRDRIDCWSAGCSSGEEAYTLSLIWRMYHHGRFRGVGLRVTGTDIDSAVLERARRAEYPRSSLRELPEAWVAGGFIKTSSDTFRLKDEFRKRVIFEPQDILLDRPKGEYDLVLCRYLAFTYFDRALQERTLARLREALRPGGLLAIGATEELPKNDLVLPWLPSTGIFRVPPGK
jgi:chemotaxis protein methyltransferase CheR